MKWYCLRFLEAQILLETKSWQIEQHQPTEKQHENKETQNPASGFIIATVRNVFTRRSHQLLHLGFNRT